MTSSAQPTVPLSRTLRPTPGGAAVEYPQSTWTSFDRYDRYAEISRLVRSALGPGKHRVLDVGDTAGYLALFDPDLWVAGLDVGLAEARLDTSCPVVGDGTRLPFADATFDAVVSSDVLEHIPPHRRNDFLDELRRVSRDLVVVAAPFDTVGVAGAEDLVRRYAGLALGGPQPQLEEHHDNGLPDLQATRNRLLGGSTEVAVVGNGNLWDWLVSMLLRFQAESRPALDPLSRGYDEFHNTSIARAAASPPFYRHIVAAWTDHGPELEAATAEPVEVDLVSLAAVLVAADSSEVVRQDLTEIVARDLLPPLAEIAEIAAGIVALHRRLDELALVVNGLPGRFDRVDEKLDNLDTRQHDTRDRIEELLDTQGEVYGPVLRAKARLELLRQNLRARRRR